MEERIIKDEYGRGIRMKKTKDGFVDATDELTEENEELENEEATEEEEVLFEFPQIDEDDEELAALMPEQAEALKKKREEERLKKQAEYEERMEKGNLFLTEKEYEKAEEEFSVAMTLAFDRSQAAVGYWRAKTKEFSSPDLLPEEYAQFGEEGYDEFVYDAGKEAGEKLTEEYGGIFRNRIQELKAEKEPLEAEVLALQNSRRETLSERKKKNLVFFLATLIPSVLFLVCGIVFLAQVNTRPDQLFLFVAAGFAAAFLIAFFIFISAANKLINTRRIIRENEDLTSTEDGARLVEIRCKENFYSKLIED